MKCHRLNEVIELLHPVWKDNSDLNLVELLQNWLMKQVLKAVYLS